MGRSCQLHRLLALSRKAWRAIKKLTGRSRRSSRLCPVCANFIATQLVKKGAQRTGGRESTRLVNKQLSDLWKIPPPVGHSISEPFRPEEFAAALRRLKSGKSPGLHSIFAEFILHPGTRSPCWHRTSRIAFQLKRKAELCLSTSQQPTTLYSTAASPASCCDCCLIDTWSTWSWRWWAIAALPLPPEIMAKEAGCDVSRTVSYRDLSWRPASSTPTVHLLPTTHRLQKVCICWRPRNHACWWRLASSGRGAEQGYGNTRLISPDMEAKPQHYKSGVGSLPSQQQGSWKWAESQLNNEILPFCSEPKYLGIPLDRSLTYRRHLESLRKKLTSQVALLGRLAGSGWGAGATTLRTATLAPVHSTAEYCPPVWCCSVHTCLIDPTINDALRFVTGCLRPTQADNLPILAGIQPAELRRSGATLSLGRRLDTCSTLRSPVHRVQMHGASNLDTHLCPPHSNSSVFLTTTTYVRRSGRIINGMPTTPQDSAFNSRHRYPPSRNDVPKKSLGLAQPPSHRCRTFPPLFVQMGYGGLCSLWVWRRRTNRRPCCPPMSNPSTSSWTVWPDGSGR